MGKFEVNEEIAASAAAVWEKIRDFGGIAAWMPGVEKCAVEGEGVGAVRTVSMGPMEVRERLEALDDTARSLSYSILAGRLPVENYLGTLTVVETGPKSSRVNWSARYDVSDGTPEEGIRDAVSGAYKGSLAALKQRLEG